MITMKIDNNNGVVDLVLEFLISSIIFIGGGFLIYKGIAQELVGGLWGMVATFWFVNQNNKRNQNAVTQAIQAYQPIPPSNQVTQTTIQTTTDQVENENSRKDG
jgi:hypothetical protein